MFEWLIPALYYTACVYWPDTTAYNVNFPPTDQRLIAYNPLNLFNRFPILKDLDRGMLVETLEEVIVDNMLSSSKNCDMVAELDKDSHWVFMKSICTNSCLADQGTSTRYNYAHTVCQDRYLSGGVCCPISKTSFFTSTFNYEVVSEFEPTRDIFHGKVSMTSVNWFKTETIGRRGGDREVLSNSLFQIELAQELVCGLRRKVVGSEKVYTMFFCAERCLASHGDLEFAAEIHWHEFCLNSLFKGSSGVRKPKNTCCHPKLFPDNYFSQKLNNWYLPQLPFYLQYAPGLRSNYMCEVYSQFVCDGDQDTCGKHPDNPSTQPRPDHIETSYIQDFPHMARLGIVAPNVLLFHCLGSVISRRYIISTFTCGDMYGIATNIVLLGNGETRHLTDTGSEALYLIDTIRNPYLEKYLASKGLLYEPTLYRTSSEIQFSATVRPACLYYRPTSRPTQGIVPYFGKMQEDYPGGWFLRKINMTINGNEENQLSYHSNCRESKFYSALSPFEDKANYRFFGVSRIHEFCASLEDSSNPNAGPCKYDLGTSMLTRLEHPYCMWKILGVLATTRWDCTLKVPFVFQNITFFVHLLENIVWPLPFLEPEVSTPKCGIHSELYWHDYWDY